MAHRPDELIRISRDLSRACGRLRFAAPVAYVYSPLEYAREPHERYLSRWGAGPKQVLLVGMNPGPFGMAQTGVPFGDVELVRSFLGIEGEVTRPAREHPKRPVLGFRCERGEVSGARLWGWAKKRFGTAGQFFERFFVANYCPLAFMEASGRNLTPDSLPVREREPLEAACDAALRRIVEVLAPEHVVGVGAFAEKSARRALAGTHVAIGQVLHPSPASPIANRGWAPAAEAGLRRLGIELP